MEIPHHFPPFPERKTIECSGSTYRRVPPRLMATTIWRQKLGKPLSLQPGGGKRCKARDRRRRRRSRRKRLAAKRASLEGVLRRTSGLKMSVIRHEIAPKHKRHYQQYFTEELPLPPSTQPRRVLPTEQLGQYARPLNDFNSYLIVLSTKTPVTFFRFKWSYWVVKPFLLFQNALSFVWLHRNWSWSAHTFI